MLRKMIVGIAAAATITATALVPTTASAKGFKGGWGHHGAWGLGIAGLALSAAAISNCYRYVETRYGTMRVNVCD